MDFFNKVKTTVGETVTTIKESDAAKQAKNYAGIPALQAKVSTCESNIKKKYEEIGKAYFEANAEAEVAPEGYEEAFAAIKENTDLIAQYKAEIEERKKKPEKTEEEEDAASDEPCCPVCNRPIALGAKFCGMCGHQMPVEEAVVEEAPAEDDAE